VGTRGQFSGSSDAFAEGRMACYFIFRVFHVLMRTDRWVSSSESQLEQITLLLVSEAVQPTMWFTYIDLCQTRVE